MEEIFASAADFKYDNSTPSTNHTGRRSFKNYFYLVLILFLGLLSVFLLVGLITLGVYCRDSSRSSAELLSAMSNQLSSMTEAKDLMTKKTKELERLLRLANQKKTCPAEWRDFSWSCYFLSKSSGSWDAARKDCRDREADLVVIDSPEEQTFLSSITQDNTWIGLNDIKHEGQWKWVDGTPLILSYWATNEPNNGGAPHHDEDCVHIRKKDHRTWNDISCISSFRWICEKI